MVQEVASQHMGTLHCLPRAVVEVALPASDQATTSFLEGVSLPLPGVCQSSSGRGGRPCSGSGLFVAGISCAKEGFRQGQACGGPVAEQVHCSPEVLDAYYPAGQVGSSSWVVVHLSRSWKFMQLLACCVVVYVQI